MRQEDCRTKNITSNREEYFTIKESIHQNDITVINMCASNDRVSN